MRRCVFSAFTIFLFALLVSGFFTGCGNVDFNRESATPLVVEPVDPGSVPGSGSDDGQTISGSTGDLHAIFSGELGIPIRSSCMGAIDPDPTGYTVTNDYDGDGIPNDQEIVTNPYVADYPRIVTRISPPITMEIRISETQSSENHSETIEDKDVANTLENSMEDRHYASLNERTTPYVTKESQSTSDSYETSTTSSRSGGFKLPSCGLDASTSKSKTTSESHAQSTMSEKTVFEDVDYTDNMDRNGVEFTNDTVEKISRNYRQSEALKNTESIGPNDGLVRAGLFIKNLSVNMPVRISNVICTLSFRTPAGEFLPIKTFRLRNEDYSVFDQEVYGNTELGPYTIEISDLNTSEVKKALANGYVPQIHVVSYDMSLVEDSNYRPGVNNLKVVEETAKGRTATIKIVAPGMREIYRVAAFDVDDEGRFCPGISLKKALFNIFQKRVGLKEEWNDSEMTVPDSGLSWKTGSDEHQFRDDVTGNSWRDFETYIKTWTDDFNEIHRIETIRRIGTLEKYNPFNISDNPDYNENELLSDSEIRKMKYWVILHDGRYFEGDINDPIWAGERYEIIFVDIDDFNNHFDTYYYTPIQSKASFLLNTRWNRLNNSEDFARSMYLGKVLKGDVIHLEVDLLESRSLFNTDLKSDFIGTPTHSDTSYIWDDFSYTFETVSEQGDGIPAEFTHSASGGTNNIAVNIGTSQYAYNYIIEFQEADNPSAPVRNVVVSAEELQENNERIVITRKTPVAPGSTEVVGLIEGGRTYNVRVRAVGICYGVTVETGSKANSTVATYVSSPGSSVGPGAFYFSTSSITNGLKVRIDDAPNTEYFIIQYEGPFNYDFGGTTPVSTTYGHSGLNVLDIPNPPVASDCISDPGLYKIRVYAVNNNTDEQGVESSAGVQNVLIAYDKYADLKNSLASIKSTRSKLNALDFEVNFNNGDEWYRIKLGSDDSVAKAIDCRYTSYVEYDKQKFHIFFRAPSGAEDPLHQCADNVFTGGRSEVDLYIRTVAHNYYRNTFWLKDSSGQNIVTDDSVGAFADFWISNPDTDATRIDDILGSGSGEGFQLSSTNINDYFFSPAEERDYRVEVSLVTDIPQIDQSQIDQPEFTAYADDKKIIISNVTSDYAHSYQVYWRNVTGVDPVHYQELVDMENVISDPSWNSLDNEVAVTEYEINGGQIVITAKANNKYMVAMVAINDYGKMCSPVIYKEAGVPAAVMPFSNDAPLSPEGINLNLGPLEDDGTGTMKPSILVTHIQVSGELRYEVQWKRESESDSAFEEEGHSSGVIERTDDSAFSYKIPNCNYWDCYHVRVRAQTMSGVNGEWCDVRMIETPEQGMIYASPIKSNTSHSTTVGIGSIQVPEGTVSYSITWNASAFFPYIAGDEFNAPLQALTQSHQGSGTYSPSTGSIWLWTISYRNYYNGYQGPSEITYSVTITAVNENGEETTKTFNFGY